MADSELPDARGFVSIHVTVGTSEEAHCIGHTLVQERLAACANVIPSIVSHYRWEGRLERDHEALILIKTRASLAREATARIIELHSYAVPCVVVLPIVGGSEDYLDWLRQATARDDA